MGSTFTGATIVPTGSAKNPVKLERDSITPNLGSLPAAGRAMTSDTGLPPTNGVDVKLIHGDAWQTIDGSVRQDVAQNVVINVTGNCDVTISGNESRTVHGNYTQEIYGQSSYLFVDSQDITNVNTVNYDFASPMNAYQPTQHFQWISWTGIGTLMQFTLASAITQAFGIQLSVGLVYNLSAASVNHQAGLIMPTTTIIKDDDSVTKADLKAVDAKIGALKVDMGAMHNRVVGLTTFCLILGLNQMM